MRKSKFICMLAVACLLIGGAIFLGTLASQKFNFSAFGEKYVESTKEITGDFSAIEVFSRHGGNLRLERSPDGICRLHTVFEEGISCRATVADGKLTVRTDNARKWYQGWAINFGVNEAGITLQLPGEAYDALTADLGSGSLYLSSEIRVAKNEITLSSGDIHANGVDLGDIRVTVSSGNGRFENCRADRFAFDGESGNIFFYGRVTGELLVTVESGNVTLKDTTAANLSAEAGSGNVDLTETSANAISAKANSGNLRLDRVTADNLNGETGSGNIYLSGIDGHTLVFKAGSGNITGNLKTGKRFYAVTDSGSIHLPPSAETPDTCDIHTGSGNITITVE